MSRERLTQWLGWAASVGFTASQAGALAHELLVLASPLVWTRDSLRIPEYRFLARAHQALASNLLSVQTPERWQSYQIDWPAFFLTLDARLRERYAPWCAASSMADHWSVLAQAESLPDLSARLVEPRAEKEQTWQEVERSLRRSFRIDDLMDAYPDAPPRAAAAAMRQTGVRSLRWGWFEDMSPSRCSQMMGVLVAAQSDLMQGWGWGDEVLGLGGRTSLSLMGTAGLVQADARGRGQTLSVGDWAVCAHEWLHTLDLTLAHEEVPAKRWATLALADAEDVTSPALEAWFTQVARVQLEELPQALHQSTSDELEKWPDRVYQTLGEMRWVLDEVAHQQRQLDEGRWTQAAAEAAWLNLLAAHGGVNDRHERTARMLSFEVDYLISMKKANVSGGWAEFLQGLPAEDKFGKRCPPGDSACRTYLAHPVEIMARSFEVSFHRNTPIWLAVGDRPNAGMIWPLAPEAAYLAQGWFSTLGLLVPWWESKKKISETSRAKPVP